MSVRETFKSFGAVSVGIGLALAGFAAMIIHSTHRPPLGTVLALLPLGWLVSVMALSGGARLIVAATRRSMPELEQRSARIRERLAAMSIPEARAFVEERARRGDVECEPWAPGTDGDRTERAPLLHGVFDGNKRLTIASTRWSIDAALDAPDDAPADWRLVGDNEFHEQVWVNMQTGRVALAIDCSPEDVPTDELLPSLWHAITMRLIEDDDPATAASTGRSDV